MYHLYVVTSNRMLVTRMMRARSSTIRLSYSPSLLIFSGSRAMIPISTVLPSNVKGVSLVTRTTFEGFYLHWGQTPTYPVGPW